MENKINAHTMLRAHLKFYMIDGMGIVCVFPGSFLSFSSNRKSIMTPISVNKQLCIDIDLAPYLLTIICCLIVERFLIPL